MHRQSSLEHEKLLMESQNSCSLGMTGGAEKMTSPSHLEFTSVGHTISKEYRDELREEEKLFWNRARDMPRQPTLLKTGGSSRSRILPDNIYDEADLFALEIS